MIVFGNLGSVPVKRLSKGGKDYFTFRLGESQGKDERRTTTWYDVSAFIDELDADLLALGQLVKLTGRLEAKAYSKKDGTPGASLSLMAWAVDPVATLPGGGNRTEGSAAGTAPAAQAPAPAAQQARPASGFDDMDDDIPF